MVGPPKTASPRRKVALNASLARMLKPLVKEAADDLVFTNMIGTPIRSSAIHKHWGPACIAAGFTEENKPRIHDIRHTSSSMFLHASADMHSLSRRLGHKDIKMTVNVYGHLIPEEHRKMAQIPTRSSTSAQVSLLVQIRQRLLNDTRWRIAPTKRFLTYK